MKINKILLSTISLLILMIGAGCLYAAKIHESNPTQISPESQVLQSGPSGGLDSGLGTGNPAINLGSGLGSALGLGLGSSNSDPQFDNYINWNDFLNPNDGNPWDHYEPLQ